MTRALIVVLGACLGMWHLPAYGITAFFPVATSTDDAEERVTTGGDNGNMSRTSTDLELVYEGNRQQLIGIRFDNVAIPNNAEIQNAYIQFTVDESDSGTTNLSIAGQRASNPLTFSGDDFDISTRTPTNNVVFWSPAPWPVQGAAGPEQQTPDLTNIVEEIFALPGWVPGNALAFIIASGSTCSPGCERTAESWNGGNSSNSQPTLVVNYNIPIPGDADLAVTQSDNPDPVGVGLDYAYTLTVTNYGPEDATNVMLTDTLPSGATLMSTAASQGSCNNGANLTCTLGNLANGTSATVILTMQASGGGTVINTADVSADEPDSFSGNNQSVESTGIHTHNNQVCYLVADAGGSNGGDDLLTEVDTADFSSATNETDIGTGTGTSSIEAIAWDSVNSTLYAANANRLGVLSTTSGTFSPRPNTFGSGDDGSGSNSVTFSDVDALAFDANANILYGVHAASGADVLFQINTATGTHVPNAFGPGADYVSVDVISGNSITDDIAVDPISGVMYAAVNAGGSTDRLIIIDKFTGATTDIAQITVPDIEGLGTDPTGQLWGASGTQNVLYEIDKSTGIGSFGRPLNNGSDYESVDCYATSPSISTDAGLAKTVDNESPSSGDTVRYTVTASNLGSGTITALQIGDSLPSGVTYVSHTLSQGIFDPSTGTWFVGTVPGTQVANLQIDATVDANTLGDLITNTATLLGMTQTDQNSTNNSASVDIQVAGLIVNKSVAGVADGISQSNWKYLPGTTVRYDIEVTNRSPLQPDGGSMVVVDPLPTLLRLQIDNPAGPIQFADGTTPSGISVSFGGLSDTGDDIDFSSDNGTTWDYVPVNQGDGTDTNVTHIRIRPQGLMNPSNGTNDPSFTLSFHATLN